EVGQHRREAIGIFEVDDGRAETYTKAVACGRVCERSGEQAGGMDQRELGLAASVIDGANLRRVREERAYHRRAALDMGPEIAKRIGVAALDDSERLRTER